MTVTHDARTKLIVKRMVYRFVRTYATYWISDVLDVQLFSRDEALKQDDEMLSRFVNTNSLIGSFEFLQVITEALVVLEARQNKSSAENLNSLCIIVQKLI